LRDEGHVTRGWLGVTVQAMNKELADSFGLASTHGALINEITKGSPADKAGLERGDIILSYDGRQIDELNDLPRLVAATPVDKTVDVTIFRDGKKRTVKVAIGKLAEGDQEVAASVEEKGVAVGITAANLTPELVQRFSLVGDEGILITKIEPDSPAAAANLRVGDLIVEVDGKAINAVGDFEKIVGTMPRGKVLRLLIQRKATLLYTTLTLE
jgi:serine protease Do